MKNRYKILYALVLLAFLTAGVFFAFMPDLVPMHYDIAGDADRFGSKYESIIYPIMMLLMAVFFAAMAKHQNRKKAYGNEKILVVSGIAVLAFFNLMEIWFLWKAAFYNKGALNLSIPIDAYKLSALGIGALLVILGNIMPKATLNSTFGLRTSWSMKNEEVWRRSQRFGGYASVICGFLTILTGIFLKGYAALIASVALIILLGIISAAESRRIYLNWFKDNTNQ